MNKQRANSLDESLDDLALDSQFGRKSSIIFPRHDNEILQYSPFSPFALLQQIIAGLQEGRRKKEE